MDFRGEGGRVSLVFGGGVNEGESVGFHGLKLGGDVSGRKGCMKRR